MTSRDMPGEPRASYDAAYADALYDELSDALKERGWTAVQRAVAQERADAAMTELDEWLRDGGILPSPWRKAARE